ncbi:MAG: riboflavin synthase [Pseudonocardiaceae bacterium]|nr:riboflavin synthase [Pseudonocardiaceae bacterium]
MFTGIVEELGAVVCRHESPDAARLGIRGRLVASDATAGDSIAVNGVCLTVVDLDGPVFTADVIGETLRRSSLGPALVGDRVNLERAAKLGDRLGGHLVQGHVDATGTVLARTPSAGSGEWELVRIGVPGRLTRYLVEKGSITVDGVSLTVIDVADEEFTIGLIPTTRELTTLGLRRGGDLVNLEVDVIAKHVERLIAPHLRPFGDSGGDNVGEEAR